MPELPFTQPWADALGTAIDESAEFREAAREWKWPIAMVMQKDTSRGVPADAAIRLEIADGRCEQVQVIAPDFPDAPFVFRAPYAVWKRIVRSELDPIAAVISGAIAFEGRLATLVTHHMVARTLVKCAQQVPTRFPDEESDS